MVTLLGCLAALVITDRFIVVRRWWRSRPAQEFAPEIVFEDEYANVWVEDGGFRLIRRVSVDPVIIF